METTLYLDADLGRVFVPEALKKLISLPGAPTRMAHRPGEIGIVTMKQHRPVYRCGATALQHTERLCREKDCLTRMELLVAGISHNERVDIGAVKQDALVFGAGTTRFTIVSVANAALTKLAANLSLGSNSADVTTNEFTTVGLSRAAGSLGSYTAPASLGAVFTRRITKVFTVSGAGGTAKGSGLHDSATVVGSFLYVEDNFTDAVLVAADTLTVNWDISN